ncbi:FCD domain-containing protein [uncultured Ilyobacter sp.]|uniref:FadR/GntR family transcriptional regulator n=1 Tax=uncultured Ilyobacter sp. TaxID=544433 RepID=UPI0029F5CBC9|nr:FCD domain-containing protein [uncultured Ilyobacter sp.]
MKKKPSVLALEYIERKILTREWRPGDKISSEKILEKEIGVSRSSIRSAVEKLVGLNMLEKKPGDGTYVNIIDSESLLNTFLPLIAFSETSYYEILQCRMQLDILAIELFIDNMLPKDLNELKSLHMKMIDSVNDRERFIEFDMEFHKTIARGSGNKTLYLMSNILYSILKEFSREQYSEIPLEEKCVHHEKLFKAIETKNKKLAVSYEESSFLESMAVLK